MEIPPIVIRVDIPALDRLVDYLTASDQPEVDAMAAQVRSATDALRQSTEALQGAIQTREQ